MNKLIIVILLVICCICKINAMGTCICGNPSNAWNDTCPNWKVCDAYCFSRGGTRFWSGPDTWN